MSPAAKTGRPEKEAKHQSEGSPSAKGSLECYLEAAKNGNSSAKSLNFIFDQNAGQVPHGDLDSRLSSRDENGGASQGQPESLDAFGSAQELKCELISDTGSVATNIIQNDSVETGNVEHNSELREFATGFLSLYCRYCMHSFYPWVGCQFIS